MPKMPYASNLSGLNPASWLSQAENTKDAESYFESKLIQSIFMAKPIKGRQKKAESSFESKSVESIFMVKSIQGRQRCRILLWIQTGWIHLHG